MAGRAMGELGVVTGRKRGWGDAGRRDVRRGTRGVRRWIGWGDAGGGLFSKINVPRRFTQSPFQLTASPHLPSSPPLSRVSHLPISHPPSPIAHLACPLALSTCTHNHSGSLNVGIGTVVRDSHRQKSRTPLTVFLPSRTLRRSHN